MTGALEDIRVIDFTHVLNGPFSTMLLGPTTNINTSLPGNVYVGCDPTSTPSKDGSGAIMMSQLRQMYKLPGIAVTGFGDQEFDRSSGFVARLIKPITLEQLERAIRSSIGDEP